MTSSFSWPRNPRKTLMTSSFSWPRNPRKTLNTFFSLVCRNLQVIDVGAELRVDEEAGRAVPVADRIDHLDHPLGGLGVRGRPDLAARAHLSIRRVLDAHFQVIPGIRLPGVRHGNRSRR